jgi:uncharacterized protein YhbP (UPF0306 family)
MTEEQKHQHTKVHEFLKHHPMAVLSTIDANSTPWGAAIYYIADSNFNFYFVTRAETLMKRNIDNHPMAALTVTDSLTQTTVQASGQISKVSAQDYMDIYFDRFAKIKPKNDYNWAPPLTKIEAGNYVPLKLTPTRMQYADFSKLKLKEDTNFIEQII